MIGRPGKLQIYTHGGNDNSRDWESRRGGHRAAFSAGLDLIGLDLIGSDCIGWVDGWMDGLDGLDEWMNGWGGRGARTTEGVNRVPKHRQCKVPDTTAL